MEVETSRVHVCLHVCSSQPSLKRRDGRGAPGSGDPGGRRQDAVQVRQSGGGKIEGRRGFPDCFLTGSCHSRAEFLSLLKNYNYFLKEQTQLHLSYAHVRLRFCHLNFSQELKTTFCQKAKRADDRVQQLTGPPPWSRVALHTFPR